MKRRCYPLRAKLDLTQQELAHFLQLPLSTVAMCERGKRIWPTRGILRLALLEAVWVAAENLPVQENPLPELVEATSKLKARMNECLETAWRLQKMLDSMKALLPLLKTKEKALQLLSEPGTTSIHQGWVEIQLYSIRKPLEENSLAKQIILEHQISTLQAEAAAAAATIEALEQKMEDERLEAAGEKHLQRCQDERLEVAGEQSQVVSGQSRQVEEVDATVLTHEPVETRLPVQPIFGSTIEREPLQKQDTIVSSAPKKYVEPPGFYLNLKISYDGTRYHRTTSMGTTIRRRLLNRNRLHETFQETGPPIIVQSVNGRLRMKA